MKPFFKKLFVMVCCYYVTLLLLQMAIDAGVRKSSEDHVDSSLIFEGKIKDQMVVFGNSRAQAHFDPELIEQWSGISTYNLGTPGANLNFERIKWESFLAHNKPKIIVQNIDLYELADKNLATKKPFLPFYGQPEMYTVLQQIDPTVTLEKWIPMSKYRGFEPLVLDGIAALFGKQFTGKRKKGYHRQTQEWNHDFDNFKKELKGKNVDYSNTDFSVGLTRLQQQIEDCKKRNIRLILVWTPQYDELTALQQPTFSQMKSRIAQIAHQNHIAFWDFSSGEISARKHYFYNSFHMNANGVVIFNRQFADSLKTVGPR